MEENKKQERKKRATNGERDSKMMAFRLDGDLRKWLAGIDNKGRLINNLLRKEMERRIEAYEEELLEDKCL